MQVSKGNIVTTESRKDQTNTNTVINRTTTDYEMKQRITIIELQRMK